MNFNLIKKSPKGSSKDISTTTSDRTTDIKNITSKKKLWSKMKTDKINEESGTEDAKSFNLGMSPMSQCNLNCYGPDGPHLRFGKPVLTVSFAVIKFLTAIAVIILVISFIFYLKLFISSIQIRAHIGYYINLVSKGDGDILPSLQAVPTLLYCIFDINAVIIIYKLFDPQERCKLNFWLFVSIIIGLVLVVFSFALIIAIISHIYHEHKSLHDGMKDAMNVYSTDSIAKSQIDQLQIEFQCCGSVKYEEWYEIKWYDTGLVNGTANKNDTSNTPFSCCSIASIYPCIHYDIEKTGKVYQYTPEYNLSISTNGCYESLRENKQKVGWIMIGNLFLIIILQSGLFAMMRLLQTAHFEKFRFEGKQRKYTVWLLGWYKGKTAKRSPPRPPPLPLELRK